MLEKLLPSQVTRRVTVVALVRREVPLLTGSRRASKMLAWSQSSSLGSLKPSSCVMRKELLHKITAQSKTSACTCAGCTRSGQLDRHRSALKNLFWLCITCTSEICCCCCC